MSDPIRFDGKVALVTGAGGGLGRSHALMLAARGAAVVVCDLGGKADGTGQSTSMADKVVDEIKAAGGIAIANYGTVDTVEGAQSMVKAALDNYGKIDILINNAGILRDKSLVKMEEADYRRVIEVHLNGSFFVTHAAFPHMRDKNYGRILFTTSAAGLWGNFGQTNYSAAKMGIVGLMNTVKLEGAKYKILANTIAPIAASRLTETIMPEAALKPLEPEYVSAMACYLCSEACKTSGGIFSAGGGHYAFAQMIESSGINMGPSDEISPEFVADNLSKIMDMTGARTYGSAQENMPKTMKAVAARMGK